MKKSHNARHFLAGVVVTALLFTLSTTAGAKSLTNKFIEVFTGLTIYVDGVEMVPTDVNGKVVETFAYNGTTYVPLRAVSQSLGKVVKWDGSTQTVYIGETPGENQYLLNVCKPYVTPYWYNDSGIINMGGQTYTHGFTCMGYGDKPNGNEVFFNLNGQYSELSFLAGIVQNNRAGRDCNIIIYTDGEIAYTLTMGRSDLPSQHSVNISGCLQLKIAVYDGYWVADGSGTYGLANMIVK